MGKTPKAAVQAALHETFRDEDGAAFSIRLAPPLSKEEMAKFEGGFPRPLPPEIRELLEYTRGFAIAAGWPPVDFTGRYAVGSGWAFPHSVEMLGDGGGNFWVLDVNKETGHWGAVFFLCHDPPIVAYQAHTLTDFLEQLFDRFRPGKRGVWIDAQAERIWGGDPWSRRVADLRTSSDPVIRKFIGALTLKDDDLLYDLRAKEIGSGFAWGRFGANAQIHRFETELLFAAVRPERKGLLRRLFGRK